jgi:hypothetical protein
VCTAEGHRLEGWVDERSDEFQQAGVGRELRRRSGRVGKKAAGHESIGESDTEGDPVKLREFHRLNAIQFVLQRQMQWIRNHVAGGDNASFSDCCRDLWLMHISATETDGGGSVRFIDSIVILYFAMLYTRISAACLYDLHVLAASGRLPYLGLYGELPKPVRRKLNESILRFSRFLESFEELRERERQMRTQFRSRNNLEFHLSLPLFLPRFCTQLSLSHQPTEDSITGWLLRTKRLLEWAGKDSTTIEDEYQLLAWLFICVKLSCQPDRWLSAAIQLHDRRLQLQTPHFVR